MKQGTHRPDRGRVNGPGGFYRCDNCGERAGLDGWRFKRDGSALACCETPMRWWTAMQVQRGEVPA